MADSKDGSSTAKSQTFHWECEDIERLIDEAMKLNLVFGA